MCGKEAIPFTVKGPINIQLIDGAVESNGGRKTGSAIMDLCFQAPCQIGELTLTNYYTAWISIYVKRAPAAKAALCSNGKSPGSGASLRARPHFERSISVDLSGSDLRRRSSSNNLHEGSGNEDLFVLETLHSHTATAAASSSLSRRRHSSGPNSAEMSDRPWECSVPMKTLMPCPHFEAGCQDVISIPATESIVEMREVIAMRIVLHQPSTVWKRFSLEDINVFKNLPKRGFSQSDDVSRQREGWLATLRLNTKKMLGGQLVEPEKYESDEGEP